MDLRTLRRRVRRNADLPAAARLFFEDVCDMHQEKGCFAGDEWFARQYGVHEKTIERYRTALKKTGVLTWYEANGKRHLVPVIPTESGEEVGDENAPQGQNRPSPDGDESVPEGQKAPLGTKSSPQNPPSRDESVPQGTKVRGRNRPHTRDNNIPPSGENTRERAGAREGQAAEDASLDLADLSADEIYKRITGHENPGIQAIDWMRQVVDEGRSRDGPLPGNTQIRRGFWEMIVRTWTDSETRNERQPQKLLKDFTTQLRDHYERAEREHGESVPADPHENRIRIIQAAAEGAGLTR